MEDKRITSFPVALSGETPVDLYSKMYELIPNTRNEAYISTPLSSGGALKIHKDNSALNPTEIKRASLRDNCMFAELFFDHASHLFTEDQITLPHKIGHREGWNEFDYNYFWITYLSGITPAAMSEFFNNINSVGVDIQTFNEHKDRNKKNQQYTALLNAFLLFLNKNSSEINPVSKLALLPDHHESLGCSLERELAQILHIPSQEIHFDTNHPDFGQFVQAAPWLTLVNGTTQYTGQNIVVFRHN